jgi:hypothetical protein
MESAGSRWLSLGTTRFQSHVYNRAVDCGFAPNYFHERPTMLNPKHIALAALSMLLASTAAAAASRGSMLQ